MTEKFITVGLLLAACTPAFAQSTSGDTTGQPTWTRPVANGPNPPVPPLSGVGTATPYQALEFTVNLSGVYTFQCTATGGWDNYTFVYANAFDPLNQFTNVVIGNDDNPNIGLSGFNVNLSSGVTYYFVVTGFGNTDFGAFTVDASSSPTFGGIVTWVPAPGAAATLLAGGLLAARRRRA